MLAVEILLQHQFSMPGDQDAVDLRAVHRLHRCVEDPLDEALDARAIDVHLLEGRRGPAVVAGQGEMVDVAARALAARIEIALVAVAAEVVGPAAIGKG